jgi:SAM-dependent methyltransferase
MALSLLETRRERILSMRTATMYLTEYIGWASIEAASCRGSMGQGRMIVSGYRASDGAAYETFLGRWTGRLADALLDFAEFPDAGDLVDVGCGTGSLALAMARRWPGRRIVGIDVAEPYIAYARARAAGLMPEFHVGDIGALSSPDAAYAGATAQLVLNFVPDADRALGEMCRVTRPGGVVVGAVWDFRGGLVYQRLFWDTAAGVDSAAGVARDRLFSGALALPDGLHGLFTRAGLAAVERASLTIRMDYADFDDYWQPLLGGQGPVGSYAAGLPPDRRAQVEAAVHAAYLSGAPDGPRSMTATAWVVRGTVPQDRSIFATGRPT